MDAQVRRDDGDSHHPGPDVGAEHRTDLAEARPRGSPSPFSSRSRQPLGELVGAVGAREVRDGHVDLGVPAASTASSSSRDSALADGPHLLEGADPAVVDLAGSA